MGSISVVFKNKSSYLEIKKIAENNCKNSPEWKDYEIEYIDVFKTITISSFNENWLELFNECHNLISLVPHSSIKEITLC